LGSKKDERHGSFRQPYGNGGPLMHSIYLASKGREKGEESPNGGVIRESGGITKA